MSRNHKPLPEWDIDPADIPRLTSAAFRLGHSASVVRGFGGWLVAIHAGVEAPIGPNTATRYRKILHQLADAGELSPPPKDGGFATIRTLGTAAMLAVSALATSRGNAPVALASLYITNIMGVAGEKGPARARR